MPSADDIAKRYERKYGHKSSASGRFTPHSDVTSTGIMALDYALGTGGWPDGTIIEVFGPPDIGKSSILGINGIIEAQKKGKMCALVALEPGFDPKWAEKLGVNLDQLVIGWPDDGQEAFDMLYDYVMDDDIGFVLFDSIGAVLRPSEAGDKGKPSQGGQSALITWGIKRIQMPAWKRKKTVILVNQIRDDMNSRIPGLVESPGGHALKHAAEIRIQLKPGKERYMAKIEGEDVMIGRQIVAVIKRTKKDEGSGKRAVFDFYSKEMADAPFGIDRVSDVLATAMRCGVIQRSGASYQHSSFPGGKLLGKSKVAEFFEQTPKAVETIRNDVLDFMNNVKVIKPAFQLVDGGADGSA